MERHNRKSHLAPQLSPSTPALLRGETVASPSKESSASKTPTSGEIPIAGGDDMKSSPPLDMSAVQRALPTEVNGSIYSTPSSSYERPVFPPRTSSTSAIQPSRSRDSEVFSSSIKSSRSRDSEIFNSATFPQPRPRDNEIFSSATFPQPRPRDGEIFNSTTFPQSRPRDGDSFISSPVAQSRSWDSDGYSSTTVLPIRPAPPPSGPLPPPPSASLRTSMSRRQATNGLAYTNGEHSQY